MVVRGALGLLVIVDARRGIRCRRGTSPTCRDASPARRPTTNRPADISPAGRALPPSARSAAFRSPWQSASAGGGRAPRPWPAARLPWRAPGRGARFRLRGVRAWLTLVPFTHSAPRPAALWSCPQRIIGHGQEPSQRPRRHPFRRKDRAAGRQAGAGRRRVPFGRAPLRPDERPDVGRSAPGLEGRAGHRGQSAEIRQAPSLCSISPAAPATWRSA